MLRVPAIVLCLATLTGCGGGRSASTATAPRAARTAASAAATVPRPPAPLHVAPSHQAVPVLMYHVIGTPPASAPYKALWVSPAEFREQVAALAGAGFQAVTLDTVLDAWRGRARLPAHPVVLSFDDGYLGQGKIAGRILLARRWPGVLNLVLHNLGVPGGLSAGRIRTMVRDGWELDAHTIDHLDLTTLGAAALRHQVAGSRAIIRRRFGVRADAFCYPAGRFDATVEAAVRAAGYRAATTELPGAARPGGDRYALPRIRVNGGEGGAAVLAQIRAALGGQNR